MLALDQIYPMEAREGIACLTPSSIDCIVTSPPYWACRDYGVPPTTWADGWVGALGLEPSPDQYVDHLIEVFDAVKSVLKPTGTLWVNLGDLYAGKWRIGHARGGHGGRGQPTPGLVPGWNHHANPRWSASTATAQDVPLKSRCLIPERFAIAMTQRGWALRNVIVWHKPNALPSSVRDRFSCSWEYVYFFAPSERYHFDLDAVRVPHRGIRGRTEPWRTFRKSPRRARESVDATVGQRQLNPRGKNPGDCWSIATRPGTGGHPAVFPEALCQRPILAGCPPCGVVLDPFAGSGTTLVVAKSLGRRYLGFDAEPRHVASARRRLGLVDHGEKHQNSDSDRSAVPTGSRP